MGLRTPLLHRVWDELLIVVFWMAVRFKAQNLKVNLSVGGWCVVETSSGNYSSGATAATTCSLALTQYYLINIQQQCIVTAFWAQFIVQSCFPQTFPSSTVRGRGFPWRPLSTITTGGTGYHLSKFKFGLKSKSEPNNLSDIYCQQSFCCWNKKAKLTGLVVLVYLRVWNMWLNKWMKISE